MNCEKTDNLLYMTVLPSSETRETFCMDIETPIDIIIGERYVVNIIGEVTSPASLKGAKDTHAITKYVTDPSLLFGEILDKFKDNSIGVLIDDYMNNSDHEFTDMLVYQPSSPTLPENAVVLGDYMLMADTIASTETTVP